MERGPDRGGRARRYHVPRADLAGVLAWEQLRHAVEDAVGAAVRAHPQRRWSSQTEPEAARRARKTGRWPPLNLSFRLGNPNKINAATMVHSVRPSNFQVY